MNRRSLNSVPLRNAITGFVNYKTAEGLSERSVDSYRWILEHWAEFEVDKNIAQLTDHETNSYPVYGVEPPGESAFFRSPNKLTNSPSRSVAAPLKKG